MTLPLLKPQEIPFDYEESDRRFLPSHAKPFVSTPAALESYGPDVIRQCLASLQKLGLVHGGLDRLQVFTDPSKPEDLWFIEDGPGGAIMALLPSDY
jgi:hypothetical protein